MGPKPINLTSKSTSEWMDTFNQIIWKKANFTSFVVHSGLQGSSSQVCEFKKTVSISH